jgi:predicted nucleic acid-binding protein
MTMVLADTSVWIGHFRGQEPGLAPLLREGLVLTHPFILGELVCGNLKKRELTLAYLNSLPSAVTAQHDEAMGIVESRKLSGLGIGWIDTHLIASALLSGCALWTFDERLKKAAIRADARQFRPHAASH